MQAMLLSYPSRNTAQASIPAEELLRVSHDISQNFSPKKALPKVEPLLKDSLTSNALLKVSQDIALYYAPQNSSPTENLTIIPINSEQLYLYWDLGVNNSHALLPSIFDSNLLLRVYSKPVNNQHAPPSLLFETPIQNIQQQKQVDLPLAGDHAVYFANIGVMTNTNNFDSIIKSNTTSMVQSKNSPIHSSNEEGLNSQLKSSTTLSRIASYYANSHCSGQGKQG